jgi:rare lipoprotein A (peptidoglycan hydrolase)
MRIVRSIPTSLHAFALPAGVACVLTLCSILAISAPAAASAATGGATAGGAAPTSQSAPSTGTSTGTEAGGTDTKAGKKTSIATWFGPGLYGQTTACGQTLTPAVVGVANRTLPCGTLVQISYRGHALTVPVLDRGPYAHGANWDLTAGAAQALNITETVHITTRVVGSAPNTPTLGSPPITAAEAATGGAQATQTTQATPGTTTG